MPPTVSVQWGYWNTSSKKFNTDVDAVSRVAIKVTVSCTAAQGNAVVVAVRLHPRLQDHRRDRHGRRRRHRRRAEREPQRSRPRPTRISRGCRRARRPSGATRPPVTAPRRSATVPVTPGTFLTFSGITGTSRCCRATCPTRARPATMSGNGTAIHHGQNWDGSVLGASTRERHRRRDHVRRAR